MRTLSSDMQKEITPQKAVEILFEGNKRFVSNLKLNRNLLQQVNETSESQFPFAVILSCIDSRTSAELIFDQGLGDIFSVRIAGNVVNEDILGSMEFACKVAGAKIIVVLGHTKCGAIKGACSNVKMGNLTGLLEKISPAIKEAKIQQPGVSQEDPVFVENVSMINVHKVANSIMQKSPILAEMIEKKEIGLVGGMYDISTGIVSFYEDVTVV